MQKGNIAKRMNREKRHMYRDSKPYFKPKLGGKQSLFKSVLNSEPRQGGKIEMLNPFNRWRAF